MLVGSVVAISTPTFPVIGLYRLASYAVPDSTLRIALFGTFGTIMAFAVRDMLPMLIDHAELLAPFAAANGFVSTVAYGSIETVVGGPQALLAAVQKLPLGKSLPASVVGAGIGTITAVFAPYLYSTALSAFLGIDIELRRFIDPIILPVSIPTGFIAGAALGPLLRPALTTTSMTWIPLTFLATLTVCGYVYRRAVWYDVVALCPGRDSIAEPGRTAYLDSKNRAASLSTLRMNALTGESMSSIHLSLDEKCSGVAFANDGGKLAEIGYEVRCAMNTALARGVHVFTDVRRARLDAALNRFQALQFFELPIPDRAVRVPEIRQRQALTTDAVARLAVKTFRSQTATHLDQRIAKEVIAQVAPLREKMRERQLDEAPSLPHLHDPAQLSVVAADSLAIVALLQRAGSSMLRREDVEKLREYEAKLNESSDGPVNIRELDAILRNSKIVLPMALWVEYKKNLDTERRRRQSIAAVVSTASIFALCYILLPFKSQ